MSDYKYDIAFVILSYNAFEVTKNCIESIKKNIDTSKYIIVIVDNGSEKSTLENLGTLRDSHISLIKLEENNGFARGNNVGIKYAFDQGSKYICCINNDTLLEQKKFYGTLDEKYTKTNVALIGPQIVRPDGRIQSFNPKLLSLDDYRKHLNAICYSDDLNFKEKIKRILLKIGIIKKLNEKRHKNNNIEQNNKNNDVNPMIEMRDVVLHGCCLIFTPDFFKKLTGFNNRTFLYYEEQLLFLSLKQAGLHSLYTPDLNFKHIGKVSTNIANGNNNKEKNQYKRNNEIESLKILIDELEKTKDIKNVK